MDLRKLIADFLTKIEHALHTPYDFTRAQKNYKDIINALHAIEASTEERDMLNVSDKDFVTRASKTDTQTRGVTLEELHQRAVWHKSNVDAEFQKIDTAASIAKAQYNTSN